MPPAEGGIEIPTHPERRALGRQGGSGGRRPFPQGGSGQGHADLRLPLQDRKGHMGSPVRQEGPWTNTLL